MRFCGGRTIASVMIIALAYLAVSLTESVLYLIFCGKDAAYLDVFSLVKTYDEAVYIVYYPGHGIKDLAYRSGIEVCIIHAETHEYGQNQHRQQIVAR